jgi:hypothetical protein
LAFITLQVNVLQQSATRGATPAIMSYNAKRKNLQRHV